jgi:hypothetical protein
MVQYIPPFIPAFFARMVEILVPTVVHLVKKFLGFVERNVTPTQNFTLNHINPILLFPVSYNSLALSFHICFSRIGC